jgi:hypothetical protein
MKLFDFFTRKPKVDDSNVVKFPKLTQPIPPVPETIPPKEEPAKIFYRFGVTDNNRLAFSMYYGEITMNKAGVQNLIDQLEFFKSQITDEE